MQVTYWKLMPNNEVAPCTTIEEFISRGGRLRSVAYTEIGSTSISTLFLGIDHSFGGEVPLLFETMIFGGPLDQYQDRCSTYNEALRMHEEAVSRVESLSL